MPFPILRLTPELVAQMASDAARPGEGMSALPAAGSSDRVGVGDGLQVSIFEVGPALFSGRSGAGTPAPGSPPSAAGEALPVITVGSDGTAVLPYAGRIKAAGLTVDVVAADIRAALAGKSQSPEVVVSVRDNVAETVVVMGDVKKPGRIPLTMAHETVLDAIALAGGAANPVQDEMVHLHRAAADATAPLAMLQAGSPDDVMLSPQDRVEVLLRPRSFTIFGATGKVSEVPLQTPRVTLAEAVARAGGPTDQQADPSAVFVFRYDHTDMNGAPVPGAKPVAYRLDLMQAQSYFLAQRFEIHSRDVVYIANAASDQPTKLLQVLNLFFQPFYTAKVVSQ